MINDIFSYIINYFVALEPAFNWSDFVQIVFLACILLFAYKKLIPYITEHEECKGLLFEDIQLTYEKEKELQQIIDEGYDNKPCQEDTETMHKLLLQAHILLPAFPVHIP